jgi:hypothetical protein
LSIHPNLKNSLLVKRPLTSTPKQSAKETINQDVKAGTENVSGIAGVWKRFIGPKEMPPRWTVAWYGEMVLICTVFAITGTSTMVLVGFALKL